jgi:hypothetical protein
MKAFYCELCYDLDIVIKLTQINQVPNNSLITNLYSKISFIVIFWLLLLLSVSPNFITLSSLDCLNLLTPTKTYRFCFNVNCSIWKDRKYHKKPCKQLHLMVAINMWRYLKLLLFVSLRLVLKKCLYFNTK